MTDGLGGRIRDRAAGRVGNAGASQREARRMAGCKKALRKAIKRRDNGEPLREIARSYDVHHSTLSRLTA